MPGIPTFTVNHGSSKPKYYSVLPFVAAELAALPSEKIRKLKTVKAEGKSYVSLVDTITWLRLLLADEEDSQCQWLLIHQIYILEQALQP